MKRSLFTHPTVNVFVDRIKDISNEYVAVMNTVRKIKKPGTRQSKLLMFQKNF